MRWLKADYVDTELETHGERVEQIREYIDRMPALSTTVTKILEVCNRPNTSANDLNRIISLDPVLTGHVLKLINSAYYALPNQISSLTRAIIMLGINTVKNLAVSTAVVGTMKGLKSQQVLPSDPFWTHSLSVGVTAKALASKRGVPEEERDDYFVAGLLHDLGKLPLAKCFADEYAAVITHAKETQVPLFQAEQEVFGFHHGWVGKEIAVKWKLGGAITQCLSCHHEHEKASPDHSAFVASVELANIYTNKEEIGTAGDSHPHSSSLPRILEILKLKWADVSNLKEPVIAELDRAQTFIKQS